MEHDTLPEHTPSGTAGVNGALGRGASGPDKPRVSGTGNSGPKPARLSTSHAPAPRSGRRLTGESVETTPTLEQRIVARDAQGNTTLRVVLPRSERFQARRQGVLEATEGTLTARSRAGRTFQRAKRVLLGERLTTAMAIHERLTKIKALAVLSSDAISSVAYATEASMGVLILAGLSALGYNLLLAAAIALLLVIVGTSYRQTIHAYPHGGGSYIVAHDNLGMWPGLIAAAALLIDYVLTVSVSVSSGIDFLISAVPRLAGLDVALGVGCILVILLINLRGIRESGTIFTAPTYLFILVFALMIVVGITHALLSPGGLFGAVPPVATPAQRGWTTGLQPVTIFLVLTAFASGCSAMTGTEAISNGIPAFKAPESRNAARTLIAMVTILAAFFLGITYLAWRFGIVPFVDQQPTVDHQIAATLFTGSFAWVVYLVDFATLLILVLAANTSFADFPRLSSILARDGFLPHQFAFRGDRLAFSVGIVVLGGLSSALLVVFHGSTDALINLYALGVFVAFTLSQTGMVVRWHRLRGAALPGWRRSMAINTVGAVTTGLVALIIAVSKFDRGAWIVVLLVPLLVALFYAIHRHYTSVQAHVAAQGRAEQTLTPTRSEDVDALAIVPVANLTPPAQQAIAYAYAISPQVIVAHVAVDPEEGERLEAEWAQLAQSRRALWEREVQAWAAYRAALGQAAIANAYRQGPQFVVIESPYRALVAPLVAYIDAVRDINPQATVTVVLPEFVPALWWEHILHNQSALRLKLALYSDPGVVVVNVPYHMLGQSSMPMPPARA